MMYRQQRLEVVRQRSVLGYLGGGHFERLEFVRYIGSTDTPGSRRRGCWERCQRRVRSGRTTKSAVVDILLSDTYAFALVFLVLCGVSSPSAAADFLFLGVTCTEDISIYRSSRIYSISFVLVQLSIQRQVRLSEIIGGCTSTALLICSGSL